MPAKKLAPTAWAEVPLSEMGALFRGRGGSKADAVDNGVPCIRYGDLYTRHDNVVRDIQSFVAASRAAAYTALQFGDVVFAGSGETHDEIGKAAAFCGTQPAVTSGDTIVLRPGQQADGRFLGYAANSISANRHKSRMGQGSSVFHISATQIGLYRLPLPPLPEQHAIAAVLDTIDDAIRKTEQIIAKLQQVKEGLLHDLLTRGIDDNGELRDSERHPEQFQDSPLGRIPKAWRVVPLRECLAATPQNGLYKAAHLIGHGTLIVGQTAITETRSIDPRLARRAVVLSSEIGAFGLRPGDILLSRVFATVTGVGLPALVPDLGESAVYESNMMRLKVDRTAMMPDLLFHWLRDRRLRSMIEARANASNQASVNQRTINPLPVGVPPAEEQKQIVSVLDDADDKIGGERNVAAKLRAAKAGLAEDLLTGRVRTTSLAEVAA